MAKRPIYIPVLSGDLFVKTHFVEFEWHPGMSVSQKQKSIRSLHNSAQQQLGLSPILEVSSKSLDQGGVDLSAFNLMIKTQKQGREFSVECAYQSSKVFEKGGPFVDLLGVSSLAAKRDPRLIDSGKLVGFSFFGSTWKLEPLTSFYDWLYINALKKKADMWETILRYSAFTDIEFNPERSINCQAYSVALFCSLYKRGILDQATASQETFLELMSSAEKSNAKQDESSQKGLSF